MSATTVRTHPSESVPVHRGARWIVLIGAIIVQLILGTVYGYSIFWQPLESGIYPKIVTRAEQASMSSTTDSSLTLNDSARVTVVETAEEAARLQEVRRGYLKYAFSICILSFALVMVLAGRVQDARGPRFTAIIGAVLMGSGFIIAGLMSSPIVFYLAHAVFIGAVGFIVLSIFHALFGRTASPDDPVMRYGPLAILTAVLIAGITIANQYVGKSGPLDRLLTLWGTVGFLAGAGIGFAYVCPIAALIKWFPEHKGLVSGLAVAGFGFGAYIFSHKSLPFGGTVYIEEHGISNFFLVHGIVSLVAITIGALMLSNPPGTAAKATAETEWQETLRSPKFAMLWPMFFSGALAGLTVIGIMKDFAGEQLVAAQGANIVLDPATREALIKQGANAVGMLAIFNAVGRVGWGFVSDRIGRTPAFVMMFAFQAVMMFVLPQLSSETALAIGASIVGFNFGGNFALFPSATADLFGAKNLGANYGLVFTSYGIAGVVGIAAGNTAKVMTGSYTYAFALAGVLCIVSAILAIALHRMQNAGAAKAA